MPTKEEIKRINSRKITTRGFCEKMLRRVGFLAYLDILKNKMKK